VYSHNSGTDSIVHGDTTPTVSRRTANNKLTILCCPSRKRSLKRLIILYLQRAEKVEGTTKKNSALCAGRIGGDLVHAFWGEGRDRRISAEIFLPSPQNAKFGGQRGTHCLLETNVGSAVSCIDSVYITIYFTL